MRNLNLHRSWGPEKLHWESRGLNCNLLFLPPLFSLPVIRCSRDAPLRPATQHREAANPSPGACKEVSHIRGRVPHTAHSLGEICMGTAL